MPTLTTPDGTRIFYRARGAGRPPFLFVHGWCSNSSHWEAQLRYFGRGHRVVAVDRRGQGRSGVPDEGYHPEQHAADLAEVARVEKIRSAIVVGHAGGGPSALAFARSYPELARAVVMVDSNIGRKADLADPNDRGGVVLRDMIERILGPHGTREFKQIYREFFSPHAGTAGRRAVADAMQTPHHVAAAELRSLTIDSRAIAEELTQPVLWLTVAGANERALAGIFRNVQFAQVVGSGHFPHIEVPDQVNAMLERFAATL